MENPPHLQELLNCLQCGYCDPVCPTLADVGWESRSPRGIVYSLKRMACPTMLDRMLRRRLPPMDEKWVRRLYQCTQCGRCARVCHVDIDLPQVWEDVRAWLVGSGRAQLPRHLAMASAIEGTRNYYGHPQSERADWMGSVRPAQKADTVFFAGCTMSYEQMALARSTVKVLRSAGVDLTVLGPDEWCCGHPLLLTGEERSFRRFAEHNIAAVERTGAIRLVTGCPGCFRTFKKTYPMKGLKVPFEVLHSSELLCSLMDRGRLKLSHSPFNDGRSGSLSSKAVIYHDPCLLGRQGGVFEAPRKLLEGIPGLGKPLEFDENRADSGCCGGGGALRAIEEEMCVRIARRRLTEAAGKGAGMVVSACPACRMNLGDGIRAMKGEDAKLRMEARDIVELVARAL